MAELDTEEQEILEAYHAGDLQRLVLSGEEIANYRNAARAVSRKDQRVNIRISTRDLEDLKIKAMEAGMPYQTLMASVLHRYASVGHTRGQMATSPMASEIAEPAACYDASPSDRDPED